MRMQTTEQELGRQLAETVGTWMQESSNVRDVYFRWSWTNWPGILILGQE